MCVSATFKATENPAFAGGDKSYHMTKF